MLRSILGNSVSSLSHRSPHLSDKNEPPSSSPPPPPANQETNNEDGLDQHCEPPSQKSPPSSNVVVIEDLEPLRFSENYSVSQAEEEQDDDDDDEPSVLLVFTTNDDDEEHHDDEDDTFEDDGNINVIAEEEEEEDPSSIHIIDMQQHPYQSEQSEMHVNDSHFANPGGSSILTEESYYATPSTSVITTTNTTTLALNYLVSCLSMEEESHDQNGVSSLTVAAAADTTTPLKVADETLQITMVDNYTKDDNNDDDDDEEEEEGGKEDKECTFPSDEEEKVGRFKNEQEQEESGLSLSFHASDMSSSDLEEMKGNTEFSPDVSLSGQQQDKELIITVLPLDEEEDLDKESSEVTTAAPSLQEDPADMLDKDNEEEEEDAVEIRQRAYELLNRMGGPPPTKEEEQAELLSMEGLSPSKQEEYNLDVLVTVGSHLLQDMVVDTSSSAAVQEESSSSSSSKGVLAQRVLLVMMFLVVSLVTGTWLFNLSCFHTPSTTLLDSPIKDQASLSPLALLVSTNTSSDDGHPSGGKEKDKQEVSVVPIPLDWTGGALTSKKMESMNSDANTAQMVAVVDLLSVVGGFEEHVDNEKSRQADIHPVVRLWNMAKTLGMGLVALWIVVLINAPSSSDEQQGLEEQEQGFPIDEDVANVPDAPTSMNDTLDCDDTTPHSWDLSEYEALKVDQLRVILRQRQCKTVGRKHILIQRLANVYAAELDTLTVLQLRPLLKRKGCKQAGRKVELIQRLVEAGME